MSKSKRRKLSSAHSKAKHPSRRPTKPAVRPPQPKQKPRGKKAQQQKQPRIIPFTPRSSILLVGEGDFSFSASLVLTHQCSRVCATSLDTLATLEAKYGAAALANLRVLADAGATVLHGVDATKLEKARRIRARAGGWDRVVFNFPHVGGAASTDVGNRQVRANQALLVGFFESAKRLLAPPKVAAAGAEEDEEDGDGEDGEDGVGGTVLVTLFEGEPYTLWNIRDLARHCGLVVRRSWKFDREVYPEYKHARTMGLVRKGGKDGEVSETAWKGELRPARTYEFGLKEAEMIALPRTGKKRKRKGSGSESESDGD